MAKWGFHCVDNGGKWQGFTVTADSKPEAIEKALKKAVRNAKGEITTWECRLNKA